MDRSVRRYALFDTLEASGKRNVNRVQVINWFP